VNQPPSPKPPPAALAMNVIGSVLLLAGVAKAFGHALPTDAYFPAGYHIGLIVVGLLMDIPLVRHYLGQSRSRGGKSPGEA